MIRRALGLVLLVPLLASGCADDDGGAGPTPTTSQAVASPTPTPSPTVSRAALPAVVAARLQVGRTLGGPGFPGGWVVAFGSVWVPEGDSGRVTRFDIRTGAPTAIDVGDPSKDAAGVDPNALSVAGERIAVTSRAARAVAIIDPGTNAVATTVDVGVSAYAVAVDDDAVWVTDFENGEVSRASVRTGKVVKRTKVPGAEGLVVAAGAAWVASETGAVYRVDGVTGVALAVPGIRGGNIETVALGAGSVWALDKSQAKVFRIDPGTSRVVAQIPVPLGEQADAGICYGGGTVWVVGGPAGPNVYGISPRTNRIAVRATLPVGIAACAFGAGRLWTFSQESASDGHEILGLDPDKL